MIEVHIGFRLRDRWIVEGRSGYTDIGPVVAGERERAPASSAETALNTGRRRAEGDLALGYLEVLRLESHPSDETGTDRPLAGSAMTVTRVCGFTVKGVSDRATEAAAFV